MLEKGVVFFLRKNMANFLVIIWIFITVVWLFTCIMIRKNWRMLIWKSCPPTLSEPHSFPLRIWQQKDQQAQNCELLAASAHVLCPIPIRTKKAAEKRILPCWFSSWWFIVATKYGVFSLHKALSFIRPILQQFSPRRSHPTSWQQTVSRLWFMIQPNFRSCFLIGIIKSLPPKNNQIFFKQPFCFITFSSEDSSPKWTSFHFNWPVW